MAAITEARLRELAEETLRAWNDHDVEAIVRTLTEDVRWTDPSLPKAIFGRDAVAGHLRENFRAFPDFHLVEDDYRMFPDAKGAAGVTTWTFTGTLTGASRETGLPPTGKAVRVPGATRIEVRDELISGIDFYYDMLDMMQQLGALPRTDGMGFRALVMADVIVARAADRVREALHR